MVQIKIQGEKVYKHRFLSRFCILGSCIHVHVKLPEQVFCFFFFLVLGEKQIQITSFKADEGSALLKMRQFVWMPSYELRSLNLSPTTGALSLFALQHRVLVLSQTSHLYIFIGTMPLSAEMLELSGNSTDSTCTEWQQSSEILKASSQMDATCLNLEELPATSAGAFQASSPQQQCPSFFSKRTLCCVALNVIGF